MSVLVTGATGFVGLNIVEQLLMAGRDVVGLSHRAMTAPVTERFAALPGRLVALAGDVRDRALVSRVLKDHGVRRAIHGAAVTANAAREMREPEEILSVNLGGLANLVTACGEAGLERLVSISSIGVYGTAPADGDMLEDDRPHSPATLYGLTKSTGEALLARLCGLHGLDHVTGRLGVVFGPYEYETGLRDTMSPLWTVTRIARAGGEAILPRRAAKNWQYGRDAAASLITLLDAPAHAHAVYNLGPDAVWTLADWCARLQTRFSGFRWSIDPAAPGAPVGLWNPRDGGLLSGGRFAAEFGPTGRYGPEAAFDDYMRFLDDPATADFRP